MTGNIVASRYAGALFSLGKQAGPGEIESYGRDLDALAEMLRDSVELFRTFRNPLFSVEEKSRLVSAVLDRIGAEKMVRNFCLLLAEKERLALLPEIQGHFSTLLDAENGVLRGTVTTAIALDEEKQDELKERLERQADRSIVLGFNEDPAILGGLILTVGDRIMDASLRAQLGILKENIKRGE